MSEKNIDDIAQRLAEFERLAITSGARVQIDPPEFSTDGEHWLPITGASAPLWARATVHRDGIPTTVYASWDESLPVETAQTDDGRLWRDLWETKPMQRFGSFVVRAALRRAFREVIGERVKPDEDAPKIAAAAATPRDWEAEIDTAPSVDAVHALHAEMKRARAVTPQLEAQLRNRLEAAAWAPSEESKSDELQDGARYHAAQIGKAEPRDYLPPTNRAARRAKSKGRRK